MTESAALQQLNEKVDRIVDWQRTIEIERAGEKVRMAHIDKSLQEIHSTIKRLVWIVVGSIFMAFITWMINGGMVNVPGA